MEQNHDMDEIDLLELARLLWSHALQIAAAGIAAAVICLLVCTFVLTPRYQASVNLIVNSRQDGNASITSDNINSARNLIDTYAVIIKSNIVLNDVIEQLGLDMTYRQLLACISVDGVGSTQICPSRSPTRTPPWPERSCRPSPRLPPMSSWTRWRPAPARS